MPSFLRWWLMRQFRPEIEAVVDAKVLFAIGVYNAVLNKNGRLMPPGLRDVWLECEREAREQMEQIIRRVMN